MIYVLSLRYLLFLCGFVIIAISPQFLLTAYNGYFFAFLLLISGAQLNKGRVARARPFLIIKILLIALTPMVFLQTLMHGNDMRDVMRDIGALLAFYVGYNAIPKLFVYGKSDWRLNALQGISSVGRIVFLMTMLGAIQAYRDGADAYLWRGAYVPFAHSWLPYIFAVNLGLARLDAQLRNRYILRAMLCVVGTLASLSRTDFVLMAFMLLIQLVSNYRGIMLDKHARRLAFFVISIFMIFLPFMLGLDVVQERINVGVDEDDPSVAWRFIENLAFLDQYLSADMFSQLFGMGLGGRLALPMGILDFDGNNTIPHLHNSYFTICMKFGFIGLIILLFYVYRLFITWWSGRRLEYNGVFLAAGWILVFVIGKAVTLQGLSEWSHILFFGFGCALILKSSSAISKLSLGTSLPLTDLRLRQSK